MDYQLGNLSAAEADAIGDKLDAFNARQTGFDDEQALRVAARGADDGLLGGLAGVTGHQWMYIHILWIDESCRGAGLGSALVDRAERIAIARGCKAACLMTFSYQAFEFYHRRGYQEFGKLPDYPDGHTLHFMKKALST